MKTSSQLIELYEQLCEHYSPDAVAVDQFDKKCFPWEPQAVAWDTCGIVEKCFYNPETNRYGKGIDEVRKKLGQSLAGIDDSLDKHIDPYLQVHAQWWGAIWGALGEERKSK